jgi:hypothetical protein
MMLAESFLHRMQMAIGGETFDRGDMGPIKRERERRAALDRTAIDMHNASAALARVAADMSPSQAKMLTQKR